jgi:hypothetical protein
MKTLSEVPDYSDLKRELEALRKRLEALESGRMHPKPAGRATRWRWLAAGPSWAFAAVVVGFLLALGVLGAQNQQAPLFIDPKGNVGIGTTNPSNPLVVQGNDNTYLKMLLISNTSTGPNAQAGIEMTQGSNTGQIFQQGTNYWLYNSANGSIIFDTNKTTKMTVGDDIAFGPGNTDPNSFHDTMRIKGNGNVGIGTTEPGAPLQIGNSSEFAQDARIRLATRQPQADGPNRRVWSVGVKYGGKDTTSPNYGFTIRDEDAGADRMVIDYATGNVGIGTPTPKASLDVKGEIRADSLTTTGNINGEKPPLSFQILATGSGNHNTVVKDIGDLCGDEDGCRIKLLMHRSVGGEVKTLTEEVYIGHPGRTKLAGGLGGYTRQSGGGEFADWRLDTDATYKLFEAWNWCMATNYIPSGFNLVSPLPPNTPTERDKSFRGDNKYKIAFSCHPHIMGTFIIYDR